MNSDLDPIARLQGSPGPADPGADPDRAPVPV